MKSDYVVERNGKRFVLYAGLLDEAHRVGLRNITTELIQIPGPENGHVAIVRARVTLETQVVQTFDGIGDASAENVSRMMVPHLIRMAETRAKARALRDAINVGEALADDPTDEDDAPTAAPTNGHAPVKETPRQWYERVRRLPEAFGYVGVPGFTDDAPEDFIVAECRKLKAYLAEKQAAGTRN